MPDDLGFTPEQAAPVAETQPAENIGFVPDGSVSKSAGSDIGFIPEDDSAAKEQKYGSGLEQAKAGIEGVAQGLAGPLATLAETHLLGVKPEDIAGRAEVNPWTHGIGEAAGIGGSLFTGYGEAALIAKAGEAIVGVSRLGKLGSTVLKGAIDAGLFQGGDEVSKFILGQEDPEAPVSSALAHMGGAALLGGVGGVALGKAGSKLQEIANGKTAGKAAQFLADIGNRFEFLSKNKDVAGAAAEEASELFGAVSSAHDEVWGNSGLKAQAIQKLVPEMDQNIAKQTQEIATNLQTKISDMVKDPDTYPSRLQKLLEKDVAEWMDVATSPQASSFENFNATQDLKRKLQLYSKFDKQITAIAPERGFVNVAKDIGYQLRTALEDEKVWGDAGKLQSGINKAFSDLQPYQKDFMRSFSTKKLGEPEIDPEKIGSVLRQIGRGKGALRGSKLADFLEPAQKFLSKVDDLHSQFGVESAYPRVSTNVLDEMLSGKSSAGSKAADWLFGGGPRSIGMAGGHAAGTAIGAIAGHPYLGYRAGEHLAPILEAGLGRKITRWGVGGALRALSAGDHSGVPQAINYAERIGKGTTAINKGVDNLFTVGGQKYLNHDFSETARETLKKYVAEGQLNQQIDDQKNSGQKENKISPQPAFANGGEVLAPEPMQPVIKPVKKILHGTDKISTVFPEQSMLLGAAKGRINGYLNQIRPQEIKTKLPFDEEMHDQEHDRTYHRALDIANKPLSVMDHLKNGTLELEHVQHMQGMYPELTNHLRKKITEKIVAAQMKDEKPPYHVRQGLSLFMGAALDSNLTPQNIMAAQTTFAVQKAQQQQPLMGNKKNTSKLGDASAQFRTTEQSAISRQSRNKP